MTDSHGFVRVRDRDQLQRAHDVLMALVDQSVPLDPIFLIRPGFRKYENGEPGVDLMFQILVAAEVLCWVLEDSRSSEFAELLDAIETFLRSQGYQVAIETARKPGGRPH